jgi:SAM-dependent methyltransferase
MKRVLKPGGLLEIDVPNAVGIRNRWRVIRGKHLTWDYEKHYLNPKPSIYRGREYYPDRHNREFTRDELSLLFHRAGFSNIEVKYLRDETVRLGPSKLKSIGSWIRNAWPQGRKTLMGIGIKEASD